VPVSPVVPGRHAFVFAAVAAWSIGVFSAADARAAAQTMVALDYETPADGTACPDADEFRASVARQLHYDPFRPAADRRVAVQIARKDVGFEGRIRWTDGEGNWVGERKLSSRRPECREIVASLAFSVAVQIQLLAALAAPVPEPPPPPPPPPPPATPPVVVERPPPPPPPPARHVKMSVGLGPALAVGMTPQPTGVGRLFVGGRADRLSLELAVDGALPSTQHQTDGSGFSLLRFAASGAACGHAGPLAACATAVTGVLRARGLGVDVPASPVGWFSQVGARIAATRDFGDRTFGTAHVDGLVMLSPSHVTLNQATVWTTPRVGALISVDVGVRF